MSDAASLPGGARKGQRAYDVFISYAHKDGRSIAVRTEDGLRERGLRVWRDEIGLSMGDSMSEGIRKGLVGSSHMVAVVTPGYLESEWDRMEIGGMLLGRHGGRVLAVLDGIGHAEATGRLAALAGTVMRSWDGGAERIIGEIARAAASGGGDGDRGLEGQGPGGGPAIAAGECDVRRRVLDAMEGHSRGTLASIPSKIAAWRYRARRRPRSPRGWSGTTGSS